MPKLIAVSSGVVVRVASNAVTIPTTLQQQWAAEFGVAVVLPDTARAAEGDLWNGTSCVEPANNALARVALRRAAEAAESKTESNGASVWQRGFFRVLDKDLTAPPGSQPTEGDRFIVASPATGAWATHENHVAEYTLGAYVFSVIADGCFAMVVDEQRIYQCVSGAWVTVDATPALSAHESATTAVHGIANTSVIVLTGDARLSDARVPTAHNQAWSTITTTPTTLAGYGITDASAASALTAHESAADPHAGYQRESERNAASGYAGLDASSKLTGAQQTYGTATNTACVGNDSRLSDARTPVTHNQAWSTITSTPTTMAGYGITDGLQPVRAAASTIAAGEYTTWLVLASNSADITGTTLTTVMSITGVGVGRYWFSCCLVYQTTALTTGIDVAVNHTGTTTQFGAEHRFAGTGTAASTAAAAQNAAGATGAIYEAQGTRTKNAIIGAGTVSVDTANADMMSVVEGFMVVSATGTLEIKLAAEAAGLVARAMQGSFLELKKLS